MCDQCQIPCSPEPSPVEGACWRDSGWSSRCSRARGSRGRHGRKRLTPEAETRTRGAGRGSAVLRSLLGGRYPATRSSPRQPFPDLVAEDVGFRAEQSPVGRVLADVELRSQPRPDGNRSQFVGLRVRGRKNDPARTPLFIAAHLIPLQTQQFADSAICRQQSDNQRPQVVTRVS